MTELDAMEEIEQATGFFVDEFACLEQGEYTWCFSWHATQPYRTIRVRHYRQTISVDFIPELWGQ